MIGVTALPVRKNQNARALLAENIRDLEAILPRIFDATVRNIECFAPEHLQDTCCVGSFTGAVFHCAARSHFSAGQIEDAGFVSPLSHLEQGSAAGLFYVIAVGGKGENV